VTTSRVHTTDPDGPPPVVLPEDDVVFRLAQLLLLLTTLHRLRQPRISLERLGCYDFLVANPMLVVTDEHDADRTRLLMAGFDGRALSYASPAHRFTTRRARLQHDLALLVAYGLVSPSAEKGISYAATPLGIDLAARFTSIYARSYRLSAEILVQRLARLSDKRLRDSVVAWTKVERSSTRPEVLDLLNVIDLLHDQQALEPVSYTTPDQRPIDGQFS
jgi:hypothetical protein